MKVFTKGSAFCFCFSAKTSAEPAGKIGGAFFGILRAGLGKGGKAMKAALRPLGEKGLY